MARPRQCNIGNLIFKNLGSRLEIKVIIFGLGPIYYEIGKSKARKLRDWLSHWLAESGQ